MTDLENVQKRILCLRETQKEWKFEIINLTIDVLSGSTHRDKDYYCKQLLKRLKEMPEIQDWDINIPSKDLPF